MNETVGYLYTMEVNENFQLNFKKISWIVLEIHLIPTANSVKENSMISGEKIEDIYRFPIGIRTVAISSTEFLINNAKFYFKGFGMHEDSDVRIKLI